MHAEDRAVEENVFPAGEFGVEAGADFQQAGHAAPEPDAPGRRLGDAAEDFKQGRFARAVAPDDADNAPPRRIWNDTSRNAQNSLSD